MFYPDDFRAKVKEVYPNWENLHRLVDSGDEAVGKYLFDSSCNGISADTILNANSLEELQETARTEKGKNDLYLQWAELQAEEFIH